MDKFNLMKNYENAFDKKKTFAIKTGDQLEKSVFIQLNDLKTKVFKTSVGVLPSRNR